MAEVKSSTVADLTAVSRLREEKKTKKKKKKRRRKKKKKKKKRRRKKKKEKRKKRSIFLSHDGTLRAFYRHNLHFSRDALVFQRESRRRARATP